MSCSLCSQLLQTGSHCVAQAGFRLLAIPLLQPPQGKVQDKGFGGAYTIMVGISSDGKVTGAKLLDNSETPGLGSKTGSADFIQRFVGVESSGVEGVQAITGATISSNAFKRCVQTAYTAFDSVNA